MLALGLEDRIVAAAVLDHDVKDEYKEAFSKVNYLEEFTPSKETIIMEKPDFILGWYSLFDDKRLGAHEFQQFSCRHSHRNRQITILTDGRYKQKSPHRRGQQKPVKPSVF